MTELQDFLQRLRARLSMLRDGDKGEHYAYQAGWQDALDACDNEIDELTDD